MAYRPTIVEQKAGGVFRPQLMKETPSRVVESASNDHRRKNLLRWLPVLADSFLSQDVSDYLKL